MIFKKLLKIETTGSNQFELEFSFSFDHGNSPSDKHSVNI